MNFVDGGRHWTKAMVGVNGGAGTSVSADVSLCAATIASDGGTLSVPDTSQSPRWRSHPLVAGPPYLRFYAGAAIVVFGQSVGVVCVFGDEPREVCKQDEQALLVLARQASAQLELRRRNAELRDIALLDLLTRLANRTLLLDRLELAVAQRQRSGGDVGVLFCDIDAFKLVNDRWGHETGDRLLCRVAECLRAATRDADTVARFAGDEFVVVCPALRSSSELDAIVERIARRIHAPQSGRVRSIPPRLSVGAVLLGNGETAYSVLRRADRAMYRVKAAAVASRA